MKLKRVSIAATIVTALMMIVAPAAFAVNVLKVDGLTSPAADVTITAPLVTGTSIQFKTDFSVPATCSTLVAGGYVKRGVTVASGTQIGALTSVVLSNCTMTALSYPISISKSGTSEWGIFATATPTSATQATIPVEIRGVDGYWRSTGSVPYPCEFGFTGTMSGTFNQNTQVLAITPATSTTYPLSIVVFTGAGTKTPAPLNVGTCGGQMFTSDRLQTTFGSQIATPGVGGIHLQ